MFTYPHQLMIISIENMISLKNHPRLRGGVPHDQVRGQQKRPINDSIYFLDAVQSLFEIHIQLLIKIDSC